MGGALCAHLQYRYTHKGGYLALFAVFLTYIIDNTIVFCTEMIPDFALVYNRFFLESPSLKTLVFIIRIISILFLISRAMPEFTMTRVLVISAIHASLLICVPLINENDLMVYFYYFPSQMVIIGVAIWGLSVIRKKPQAYGTSDGLRLKKILLYLLVMTTLILLEDTFVIFFVDVYSWPGLKIFNRNFSENILFVGLSLLYVEYFFRNFSSIQDVLVHIEEEQASHDEESTVNPVVEFSRNYGLTERETDILRGLLAGKSQQEISEELIIALGTVKTHTHNIYRKTDTANRNQIVQRYQQYLPK
jgi:DNA-binding CsgD family transcriptional regulator